MAQNQNSKGSYVSFLSFSIRAIPVECLTELSDLPLLHRKTVRTKNELNIKCVHTVLFYFGSVKKGNVTLKFSIYRLIVIAKLISMIL